MAKRLDRISIALHMPRAYQHAIRRAANMEGMFVTTYIRHLISQDLRAKGLMPAESWVFGPRSIALLDGESEYKEADVEPTETEEADLQTTK